MIHLDLKSRLMLWPIIKKRMDRCEASLKYSHLDLEKFEPKIPEWDNSKVFEAHDLFQAFEVDGDGLIEIMEL